MTAPVIELDLDQPPAGEAPIGAPAVLPFHIWAQAWARQRPGWAGIAIGCAISAVAAIAILTALVVRWWPPDPPLAAPLTHAFTVHTTGDEVTTAIRRGDAVARGEMLGAEPFGMSDVTSMAVTVRGAGASCRITVDGQVADEAHTSETVTSVTCLWTAPAQ